ncbi:hypothetical protein [Rossellomorea sp. RS05]
MLTLSTGNKPDTSVVLSAILLTTNDGLIPPPKVTEMAAVVV